MMYLTSGPDPKAERLALLLWPYPKEQQALPCVRKRPAISSDDEESISSKENSESESPPALKECTSDSEDDPRDSSQESSSDNEDMPNEVITLLKRIG
jgi:hypothetical protein